MTRAPDKNDQHIQFEVNNLYTTVYENGSTIRTLDVSREFNENVDLDPNHWLAPLIRDRFHMQVSVPWSRLSLDHLTDFQRSVLKALDDIPAGTTVSYGDMAESIDRPGASRAVGQALKQNPYPILLPCHRVIRSDGTPGGYGGQPDSNLKKHLLELEEAPLKTPS